MDSKTICKMGTFLGFILALRLASFFDPFLSNCAWWIGWLLGGVFVGILGYRNWFYTTTILYCTKLPQLYRLSVDCIYEFNLIEQYAYQYDAEMAIFYILKNNIAPIFILSITILYFVIPLIIHLYLTRTGFYRRIPTL